MDYKQAYEKFTANAKKSQELTLWRDMTDAEKGALLLARHEGKVIQAMHCKSEGWETCIEPAWFHSSAYRIKPEPKKPREVWVLFADSGVPVGLFVNKADAIAAKWGNMTVSRMIEADDQ